MRHAIRLAAVAALATSCGSKNTSNEVPATGSGSGSAGLALADAVAIVCGAPAKAKQDPKWDHNDKEGGNIGLLATYVRPALANAEVKAAWQSDRGGPKDKIWLDLAQRAGLSSCGYVDYLHESFAKAKTEAEQEQHAAGIDPNSPTAPIETRPSALCPKGEMPTNNALLRIDAGSEFLEEELTNFTFANTKWVGRTATVKIGVCEAKGAVTCDRSTLKWVGSHQTKIGGDDHHIVIDLPPGFRRDCKAITP